MYKVIFIIVASILLALGSGIVATWDKLTSSEQKKKILGVIALALILLSQGLQAWQTWTKQEELMIKEEEERISSEFIKAALPEIDEASGGALTDEGKLAYLVDDEEPALFRLKFDEREKRYKSDRKIEVKMTTIPQIVSEAAADAGPTRSRNKMFDDFEGAAEYNGDLYLITSHSNKQNGDRCQEREWFLQVSLKKDREGEVIRGTNRLRKAILEEFNQRLTPEDDVIGTDRLNKERNKEVMNIEALAFDDAGRAYIGFREPLAGGRYAVVLSVPLEELFSEHPQFKRHLLDLQHIDVQGKSNNYAIVSMDFDARAGDILILGNSVERDEFFKPVVWTWPVRGNAASQWSSKGKEFTIEKPEYVPSSKPEAVLVSPREEVYFFLDAKRYGGQWAFPRK